MFLVFSWQVRVTDISDSKETINERIISDLKIGCEFLWVSLIASSLNIEENIRASDDYELKKQYHDRIEIILNKVKELKTSVDLYFDQLFFQETR